MTDLGIAKQFQTVRETASAWGTSGVWVKRLIDQGRVPAEFFGSAYFLPRGVQRPPALPRAKRTKRPDPPRKVLTLPSALMRRLRAAQREVHANTP